MPVAPVAKNPPSFHRFASAAWVPSGLTKSVLTKIAPTAIRQRIAATFINANQNSISPKLRTLNKFSERISVTVRMAGSHAGTSGHQYCE
ncbi:hypothetical protein NJB14197_41500 [Mycobacterium montefiorense]|uniref:Uncharacterized protein n=1 Tax=Mycobacterium montefiorense TaxID=154654 RepID=A0AA37UT89_9MYCO|nr:hypothetical protein MmonteBS_02900 [Mycobacterium montefiorense]GKU35422.1 hypothetical protein NJB14191_27680 [Mycobacterium montefiorense]GKU40423.1 hypothetical protein NJB14192_24100 [Mycobacterium montefiorense]GKU45801.1 hypothetical protein NJB14194_24220 [Mycobacterium montefiorense]GKU58290.1 hypothetical protein NJB14197_41500 [Mycobacterium montefiorense]